MPRPDRRLRGALPLAPLLLLAAGLVVLVLALVFFMDGSANDPSRTLPEPAVGAQTGDAPVQPGALGALAPGLLPGEGEVLLELRWLGARDDARSVPQLSGRIEGQVLGPSGEPVSGALITVVGGPQDGLFTRTDTLGRYGLGQMLGGTHFFAIEGAGLMRAVRMQRVLERAPTHRDFIVGNAMPLRVVVRDYENKVISGALVSTDRGERSALSGEDGVAEVADVPTGPRVLLEIQAAGHVPSRYEVNFAGSAASGAPIELPALPRAGTLRVAVGSWPGGPQPRVTVIPRATSPTGFQPTWERWQEVEVDRNGVALLEGLPTTQLLDLRVVHPMGTSDPPVRALRPSAETPLIAEFVVRKSSASVRGRVTDTAGDPVAGATCVLASLRPDLVLSQLYPGLSEAQTALPLPVPGALRRTVLSEADGAFLFAVGDHPDGTGGLVLAVSKEGYRPARVDVRTLGSEVQIRLTPASRSSALVVERRDGGEVPPVRFRLDGKDLPNEGGNRISNLWPGFYEVLATRGEFRLTYRAEYWVEGQTQLDLSP